MLQEETRETRMTTWAVSKKRHILIACRKRQRQIVRLGLQVKNTTSLSHNAEYLDYYIRSVYTIKSLSTGHEIAKEFSKASRKMGQLSLRMVGRIFDLYCIAPSFFTLGDKISYAGVGQEGHLHSPPRQPML